MRKLPINQQHMRSQRFHAWAPFKQINFEIAHEFFLFSKPPVEVWEFLLQLFVPFIASDFGQALSKHRLASTHRSGKSAALIASAIMLPNPATLKGFPKTVVNIAKCERGQCLRISFSSGCKRIFSLAPEPPTSRRKRGGFVFNDPRRTSVPRAFIGAKQKPRDCPGFVCVSLNFAL